ncbi:AfsR/SARP family transcriptional regulator [Lentzea sp. NPDC051838]|uniref:AfsR/SARP family transcriptional regulator n=1 Tax=Lentzea sp. NPDC051838 TaxID=3154849 RepID=UPI003434BC94
MGVELCLLGEITARIDGRAVDLGPARQRCVWAALAVDVNRVVSVEALTERVWGEHPPWRARATLLTYLSRLRRAFGGAVEIGRRSGGYVLVAEESFVDLFRFRELRARAGDSVPMLTEALALWQGEPLTGLTGRWAEAERDRLRQERLAAERDLDDARLRVGQGGELVADLSGRLSRSPFDERLTRQLMLALYRSGRQVEALRIFHRTRRSLVEELGLDPGHELRQLHEQILVGAPGLIAGRVGTVPRQLPAAPAPFVGRRIELTPGITAVAGAGGIGKTWLALHWAHADLFPDGQLFVDLHGFSSSGRPMSPAVALHGFLDGLGAGRIPADLHARSAMFRSMSAGRRMIVVLDNAVDAAQVVPLLPGGTCTVVVTSRNRLPGLVTAHNARQVLLEPLPAADARALLVSRLGGRVAAEPAAVDALIELCGGFPLALSVLSGLARDRPDASLASFAADLRERGLAALDSEDPAASLPDVLSWSYRHLTAAETRAFTVLSLAPGPDISLLGAAVLLGLPQHEARAVLRRLEHASLVARDTRDRYRVHDLLRRHAIAAARCLPAPRQGGFRPCSRTG